MRSVRAFTWLKCLRIELWMLIHAGALVLTFICLTLLTMACRRRRRLRAPSQMMASNYSGQPPQSSPSRQQAQQQGQTAYMPDTTNVRWYYPAQGTAPPGQAKGTVPLGQAQRHLPWEQVPSTVPEQPPSTALYHEAQRSDQVQRPASTSQVMGSPTSGQVQRTAPSEQVQRPPPANQEQFTVPPGQIHTISPAGRTQSVATQGVHIPLPQTTRAKGIQSVGAANNGDQSPPPYYPVSRPFFFSRFTVDHLPSQLHFLKPTPPIPPLAHTAR